MELSERRIPRIPVSRFPKASAMQVLTAEDGSKRMGLLTQVELSANIKTCGPGFNDRTVLVRLDDSLYYMFREDLKTAGIEPDEFVFKSTA